ncbi:hypothetical protein FRC00_004358 [Tulasnella sp. 408]|nr:hypothetical protein FRC00_004358 [Tulasnella sp. 408]
MSNQPDLSQKRALNHLKREAGLSLDGEDLLIRPAEVGAVIYWDKAHSRLLVDTIPGGHGFDVLKSSMLLDGARLVPVSENAEATQLLRDDMYKFCYERGVDAISVEMHASRMQSLLNDVHHAQNGKEQSKHARRNLRHYIYMYCSCKIWQRITARAPRFGHQIAHFFLDKGGKDLLLSNEAFDDKMSVPLASCRLDQDETWLRNLLRGFDQTGAVEYELEEVHLESSKVVQHLILNKDVLWNLYMFAARLEKLEKLKKGTVVDAKEVVHESRPSGSSSSTNSYIPSTESPLSPTDAVSRPHGSKYKERGQNRLADDYLADELGLNVFHTFTDVVRGWLQSITQWYHAVQDLCDGETVRAAVQHGFSVNATTAARPQLPHRQRSLISTLLSLQRPKNWSLEQARDAIKAKATQLVQSMELQPRAGAIATDAKVVPSTIHDRQLKALQILADFSEEAVQEWEEAFEGWVHCEADLACRMFLDDKNICEGLIGFSQRCCFYCDFVLSSFHSHFKGAPSHGKIYPWAPPPETPGFVKQQVIFNMTIEFDRFVRHYLNEKETERSPTIHPEDKILTQCLPT